MTPRGAVAKPVIPESVSITSHPVTPAGSEPGTFLRQTKAGENAGRSTRTTSTLVIFTLMPPLFVTF